MTREEAIAALAEALDELERDIEAIEGEWGSGSSIESMRKAGAPDVIILDKARLALEQLRAE